MLCLICMLADTHLGGSSVGALWRPRCIALANQSILFSKEDEDDVIHQMRLLDVSTHDVHVKQTNSSHVHNMRLYVRLRSVKCMREIKIEVLRIRF